MRGYSLYVRSAGAAIAAVLAFGPTYAFAQEEVAPPVSAPVTTEVVPPAAPAPVLAPSTPMVQPTQSVDERIAEAVAASEAERAAAAAPAPAPAESTERRVAAERPHPSRTATATAAPREPVTDPLQPQEAASAPVAPVAPNMSAPEVTAADPVVQEQPAAASNGPDESLYWALGGGALLLLGLGGAAALRRRRVDEDAVTPYAQTPVRDEPMAAKPASVASSATPTHSPAQPVGAAAPVHGSLAAMVAAPPSAENPFRTHAKRMRRARYLLAQRERQDAAVHAPVSTPVAPQTTHAEPQMQTVYRLGKDRSRNMGFKPQTR